MYNKEKRLKYAKQYNHWMQEIFNRVLLTDQSKFELFDSKNRQYLRRRVNNHVVNVFNLYFKLINKQAVKIYAF